MSQNFPQQVAKLITEDPDVIREASRGWQYEKKLEAEELEDPELLGDLMYYVEFTMVANFYPGEERVMYYPDGSGYPGSPPETEWDIQSIDLAEAVDEDGEEVKVELTDELKKKLTEALLKKINDEDVFDYFESDLEAASEPPEPDYDEYRSRRGGGYVGGIDDFGSGSMY
jgi:hypothetical protein